MILMSPPLGEYLRVGEDGESAREELLRKADLMEVDAFSIKSLPADWSDDDAREARAFLDDNDLRVGEFTGFYKGTRPWGGLGGYDVEDHEYTIDLYRRQLRHAAILGAHFVGFGLLVGRGTPRMWDDDVWAQCLNGVRELAAMAEEAGIDVAGHPHLQSPLYSVARYVQMLDSVPSPRLKILIDPVNMVTPEMVYRTGELVDEIFDNLGDYVVGLHAKDVTMSGGGKIVAHLDEAVPGAGTMDYATILRRLDALDHDVTLFPEHFPFAETVQGQQYIRSVARKIGVTLN